MPTPRYSINGVTASSGGSSIAAAAEVTIPSVSLGASGVTGDDFSGPYLWWKFTATQGRQLLIDAGMSYATATGVTSFFEPRVSIDVYESTIGPAAASFDDLDHVGGGVFDAFNEVFDVYSNCGVSAPELTEGSTYYVALHERPGGAPAGLVLRVSDYGIITDWIQGDDQTWVLNPSTGTGHPRQLPPVAAFPGASYGPQHQAAFEGEYSLSQSFGGPAPSDDSATYDVLWHNARAGQAGGEFWSPDPLNPDVDIHASWFDGPGTPIYKDDGRPLEGRGPEVDDFVGILWGVDKSLGPATAGYTTWAHCWRFNVTSITRDYIRSPSGGAFNPTDFPDVPGGFTGSFEWDADSAQLVGLAAAPDEAADVGNTNGTCRVYAKVVPTADGDGWGPNAYGDTGVHADAWAGGLDRPESFPGKQDLELTAVAGPWAGGSYPWVDLTDLLATILAREAEDEATFSHSGSYPGALRFVSLPKDLLSTGVPTDAVAPDPDDDEVLGRNRQVIALQLTMRPARHRWIGVPRYSLVTVSIFAPIRLEPRDDDGLGAAGAARLWPPVRDNRLIGNIP